LPLLVLLWYLVFFCWKMSSRSHDCTSGKMLSGSMREEALQNCSSRAGMRFAERAQSGTFFLGAAFSSSLSLSDSSPSSLSEIS